MPRATRKRHVYQTTEESCKICPSRKLSGLLWLCRYVYHVGQKTLSSIWAVPSVQDANSPLVLKLRRHASNLKVYTYGWTDAIWNAWRSAFTKGSTRTTWNTVWGPWIYRRQTGWIGYPISLRPVVTVSSWIKIYPHIPYYEFPGQVLGVELYKECGLRACDIGSYMLGNDPDTGKQLESLNEFTRLAIPRRVYTQSHFDMVIEAIDNVWRRRNDIKRGYQIIWEPPILRHFQASLAPIENWCEHSENRLPQRLYGLGCHCLFKNMGT